MTTEEIAKIHAKNKAQLRKAMTQLNRALNLSLKQEDDFMAYVNIRLYFFLCVSWIETTLNYIVFKNNVQLNQQRRNEILSESNQSSKWRKLIEIGFRISYLNGDRRKALNLINLGHSGFSKYEYLVKILEEDLTTFIEIRNKLAHGQWAIALNNEGNSKNQDTTAKIWTLSKKDTLLLKNIGFNFTQLVNLLIQGKNGFEKDFDFLVGKLETARLEFTTKYQWIIDDMKNRYNKYDRKVIKK